MDKRYEGTEKKENEKVRKKEGKNETQEIKIEKERKKERNVNGQNI